MNQLFNFNENNLRVVIKDGEPWFVASDVCTILEIGNVSMAVSRLDQVEKGLISIDTLGGTQSVIGVNESGLYELIFGSRKKEAREFKNWVKRDVLPSIRKNGAYMTPETIEKTLTNPDFIIQLATQLKDEQSARIAAENKLDVQKPLVTFAETCMTSDKSLLVREVAKLASKQGVMIGERRLFQKLRDWGMFLQHRNEPTQHGMEMGLFEIKKGVYAHPDGARDYATPKVTVKGQMYIINRLRKEAA